MEKTENGRSLMSLTSRRINERLKRPDTKTMSAFLFEYNCSEAELHERLKQVFKDKPGHADEVMAILRKNEKKASRKTTPKLVGPIVPPSGELTPEPAAEEADVQVTEETEGASLQNASLLQSLRQQEGLLSEDIINLEVRHSEKVDEVRGHRQRLRDIKEEVQELKKTLAAKCDEFTSISAQANACIGEMNAISAERRPKVEELAAIRQQIEELVTVTICVYASGEISIDGLEFVADTTGNEEIRQELLGKDYVEELRMKDIRALAEVIAIVGNGGDATKINVLFDKNEMEAAYNQYRS